jgi:hemerythrin-like metal-binding domain
MSLITWKSEYSVGISEFDSQHKVLVDLINKLHDAMKAGEGKQVLAVILEELIDYTKVHFREEEKYFGLHKYPEAASHIMEHEKLTRQVLEFQKDYTEGKSSMSIDVMSFLKNWLINHIAGVDKKYTQFFIAKGIR